MNAEYDVVVVGAGPNGLTAAAIFARSGLSTLLIESAETVGGGSRSRPLTLPGFVHDVCSTVHPLALASPFLSTLGLERYGLSWAYSPSPVAHVLEPARAVRLDQSIETTAELLGPDGAAYRKLFARFVDHFDPLLEAILGPLRFPTRPLFLADFGLLALRSLEGLVRSRFRGPEAPALLAGIAAHAMLPLDRPATASFGLVLTIAAHAVAWPIARGGSQSIADALCRLFTDAGGEVQTGFRVTRLDELPKARAYVFDLGPKQLTTIAGDALPQRYRDRLSRFRFGPGVYKMDWALSGPIPWKDPACAGACTVHLSGDLDEVARAEAAVHEGRFAARPFVILVQPSLFDPTRAPAGKHVAWAYCHVPHGSPLDASQAIEDQIERAAPGFRDLVLGRATKNALEMEQWNPNYVGGDINGGVSDLGQLFFRPVASFDPYSTPNPKLFLCSSSTPPGGGVHGMCGYWAARSVLQRVFQKEPPPLRSKGVPERAPAGHNAGLSSES